MIDPDDFDGRAEGNALEIKRQPVETDILVTHLQAGLNGREPFTLILGAEENAGRFDKTRLNPITWPIQVKKTTFSDLDAYRRHVLQTLEASTEGYRSGHVAIGEVPIPGGVLIVFRVDPLPGGPYQNLKDKKFYGRDGPRTRPMSGPEIRGAAGTTDTRRARVWPMPGDELRNVGHDAMHPKGVVVEDSDALVRFRLLAPVPPARTMSPTRIRDRLDRFFGMSTLGTLSSGDSGRNRLGYAAWWYGNFVEGGPDEARTISQAFGDGEIAGLHTGLLSEGAVPVPALQNVLYGALEEFRRHLRALGFPPPYHWCASLDGIEGFRLLFGNTGRSEPILDERVEEWGDDDGTAPPHDVLKPFFDAILEAGGVTPG